MSKHGTKHTCWSCGTKFYDLGRPAPKCPKCGSDPKDAPVAASEAVVDEEDFDMPNLDDDFGNEEE